MHGRRRHGNVFVMLKRSALSLLALVLACAGSKPSTVSATPTEITLAPPAASDPELEPLPLWPEVTRGTLSNGLTYYILKHGKPEKRAMLWLAVNAGSVQEDDDQRGLAHFDEHMAFNGTKRFPKQELIGYLEKIGMRFGADVNASTSWDQTVFQLEVPTDGPAFIGKGLDILRDWAGSVSYEPEEIEKERGVVLEEWRLGRGAGKRLFDKHAKVLFSGSRYAERAAIGLPEILEAAKPEALTRFYRDWYRPELMAVIAVGDFDGSQLAQLETEIKARFGDLKNPDQARARPRGGVPPATGTRVSIETDKEQTGISVTVSNLTGHRPESSRQDYRRQLGERLYGMILSGRFASLARKPDAPFLFATGGWHPATREIDTFDRFAHAKAGKTEDALRALMTEVLRTEKYGVGETELERARASLKRSVERLAETEATIDSRSLSSEITRNFFEAELMIGAAKEKELTLEWLPKVTVDELNRLAKGFAGPDGRVIVISGPDGEPMPTNDRVLAIIDEVGKAAIEPWEDKVETKPLLSKAPVAGRIIKEKKIPAIDVTEWTLSNGVRVIVKPTDYEIDAVQLAGNSPGGEVTASDQSFNDARFADEVVRAGGVGDFDVEALGKVLTDKQIHVSTAIGESTESISASGSARDLEAMLQLVYLRVTSPRKDPQAFEVWKHSTIERLTNMQRAPEATYTRESIAALFKNNPRRKLPEPPDVAKVDPDQALGFYRARFGDVSDFTFVIVGAVDLEKLEPLVETYLASLPAKGRKETEKDLGIRKVGGVVTRAWKLGQEKKAMVNLEFHGDETWSRDKDRDMFILGQILSIKLREELRENMSGVYGVAAGGTILRSPHQERSFRIHFGCDPDRVEELVKAVFAEIETIKMNGVAQDDLDRVKETFLRSRETDLRKNGTWVGWLSASYRFGDDPTLILDPSKVIARMTPGHVKAAAKRYLDRKTYFESVLLPAPAP